MRVVRGLSIVALALAGCAEAESTLDAEPQFVWQEDDSGDEVEIVDKANTCGTRWIPDAATVEAASRVRYDGAGSRCSGGATEGARALGEHVVDRFGHLMNLDVPGDGVQIYACRRVNGGSGMSVHSTGRAADLFISTRGGDADNARGDMVANWLAANAGHIGVQMIIWDRTIWTFDGRAPRCYSGAHPHNDHIHVELNTDGAAMRTPFFRGEAPDQPVAPSPPPNVSTAWVGDACRADGDCAFAADGERGACFLGHRPDNGVGFCTLRCAGYCPDKSGRATTFCAEAEALGGLEGTGLCASKSESANDRCRRHGGLVELEVDRYVGRTSASRARATVCAPSDVLGVVEDPGPVEPPPERGNEICDDRALPMSDNGFACAGTGENTWRCACSGRLETTVSQVCRDGIWLNFQTDPRDCGRCDGRYTNGCNR